MTYYRQCVIRKDNRSQVSWLPEQRAEIGRILKIREPGGPWDDGWVVEYVGPIRLQEAYVVEHSQDYKKQRDASDIPRDPNRRKIKV